MTDLIARLAALRAECEQRPICEDYAYQAIRHINRNCDMQCESHADGSECVEWARYDGTALAVLWNEWPAILHALKVAEAAEKWEPLYQIVTYGEPKFADHKEFEQAERALVAAVKGEQG